jgi:class 3 adenylate cyclase
MTVDGHSRDTGGWTLLIALAIPAAVLVLLLTRPELDITWEHHPSHFWLVLLTAAVNAALAYLTGEAADRRGDARLFLVSLAFLASAGFLALHALATPGVLLPAPNAGFVVATPVGLVVASGFAAASTSPLAGPRASALLRLRTPLRIGLLGLLVAWGALSLARLPPLNGPLPPQEAAGPISVMAAVAVALYAWAAWQTFQLYRRRGSRLALAIVVALVLLAEAMLAVALSRNWQLSWWEWHVLLTAATAAIAVGTQLEYRRTGSLTAAFGGIYLEATLDRLDRWHSRAIADLARAQERGESPDRLLGHLRREGATAEEVRLLAEAAREIRRVDELFRPYLPAQVAQQLRHSPATARLGGEERQVSVLFADLAGFTEFSERHAPAEVLGMLNEYWAAVVPVIDAAHGVIERFAGDGIMVIFNAVGEQLDHAVRAAEAALGIVRATAPVGEHHPGWPRFRVGVNTGTAVVGNVGTAGQRSFAAIGDTTNLAARLLHAGAPGQVVVGQATWESLARLPDPPRGTPLGPLQVRGKREPVEAWVLGASG